MKFKNIFIMLCIQAILSSYSYAGAGWSGAGTVEGIYATGESTAVIKLSKFSNPGSCDTTTDGDIIIDPSTQKTWYTMLLSAYMAGKKVNVYVTGDCGKTHWATPSFGIIGHVRLL